MRKIIWLFLALGGLHSAASAWPRLGSAANIVTQNAGDRASGVSVSVSSTSATLVYTGTAKHREVLLQNTDSTYYVHCGTHSAVTAASGPRWLLPPKPTGFTTNGTYSIYCIGEAGAGTIEVVGSVEFDSKD